MGSMQVTTLIFVALGIIGLTVLGVVAFVTISERTSSGGPNPIPEPIEVGIGISAGKLVRGAACQQDADCAYAENAYPGLRCISPNCPPEEDPNQPTQGDPAYEWLDAYQGACVNAGELQGNNLAGEPLLVNARDFSCACEPIPAGPNGEQTSLTEQKVCTVRTNE